MGLWILLVAAPVAVSTVVAVSACMLSSRRNRSLETPELHPGEDMNSADEACRTVCSAPASPSSRCP